MNASTNTVLDEVREVGPATAKDIALNTGLKEPTVRRHLAELEAAGFVESDSYQRRARVFMPVETAGGSP
jgi:predicted ArsR family transcriptional regulator